MATEPDQIRSSIEATRADLASNVDQLADRTNPARALNRGWHRVTGKVHAISDTVMGVPSTAADTVKQKAGQAGERISDVAEETADAVREAPRLAAAQTRGNPLAAGMIAFGAGLLAAALIPESDAERRLTHKLADNELVDRVREPLKESADHLRQDLTGDLKESGRQLVDSAKQHTSSVVDEAKQNAETVKQQASSSQ